MKEGWICPRCKRVNAPHIAHCICFSTYIQPKPITKKPPLGVMPRWLFLENRIEELITAISRYLITPGLHNLDLVIKWTEELNIVLAERKQLKRG